MHWRRHRRDAKVSSRQHCSRFCWNVFHHMLAVDFPLATNGATIEAIPLYPYEAKFIQSKLWEKQINLRIQIYTLITCCPLIIQTLTNTWVKCRQLSLRSKTRRSAKHFCFLLGFTPVHQEGSEIYNSLLRQTVDFNFNLTNIPFLSVAT